MTVQEMATLSLVTEGETTGQAVRRRRKVLRLSGPQLADEIGVHRNTIGRIERDEPNVDHDTIEAVLVGLERLEKRWGADRPDDVVQVIELPDGTKATFTGSVDNVAELVARFLANRKG